MGIPERKFLAEAAKGLARGASSAAAESKMPTPFVNFIAKLCESGEDLIDDFLLTPVMKQKFDEKMTQKAEVIPRPKDDEESTELVTVQPKDVQSSEPKEDGFHW